MAAKRDALLHWGWRRNAGLLCIAGRSWYLHLAIQPRHWVWGKETEPYDCLCDYWGAGPLFLFVYNLPSVLRRR